MLEVATISLLKKWRTSEQPFAYFGSGYIADKTLQKTAIKPIKIIDNNRDIQGTEQDGIRVVSASEGVDTKLRYVITSTSIAEIEQQLLDLGISGSNIYVSPVLHDHLLLHDFENLDFDFLFTSGLQNRSQRQDSISGGGLYRLQGTFDDFEVTTILPGASHGIRKVGELIYVVNEPLGVAVLDKNLDLIDSYELPKHFRPHGLDYCVERKEWALACSYADAVLILDEDFKQKNSICISSQRKNYGGKAQHHTNDICISGRRAYLSMFSLEGEFKRGHYDGGVKVLDLDNSEFVGSMYGSLSHPHNVQFYNGDIYILDSFNKVVYRGSHKIADGFTSFLRGLDFVNERIILLGQSKNRNFSSIKRFDSTPTFLDTSVVVLSLDPFLAKTLPLPSSISEIHGILNLN